MGEPTCGPGSWVPPHTCQFSEPGLSYIHHCHLDLFPIPTRKDAEPGFKSWLKSSSATPLLVAQSAIPVSSPVFFQPFGAAIESLGRCGPAAWSEPSPSSHTVSVRGAASQLQHWLKSLPSPWLKIWPQLSNISMKLASCYRYVK